MLWEAEIRPAQGEVDREGRRVLSEAQALGAGSITAISSARSFLIEGDLSAEPDCGPVAGLLADPVVETCRLRRLGNAGSVTEREHAGDQTILLNVLFKPGVTDSVGETAAVALRDLGVAVERVATCRKYWINRTANAAEIERVCSRVLANDAIEEVVRGPLRLESLALGREYRFELVRVPLRELDDESLLRLSREGQLSLSLAEMHTIQRHFRELGREPTDVELETIAQTWSEHCSHKTLSGRIHYRDGDGERRFENMLKETIFAATQAIRARLGEADWCVSVFRDNAGVVRFNEAYDVCIKVETHNHPSAIEPYGGANTGLGGVIRDPLGTGLGAKPVCNTDVFCFAPPDTPYEALPPGVLHPRAVMKGVVAGVRDYGNRMGIPTVNGAVYFDRRYLGNPLVFCGNVALLPRGKSEKQVDPGDLIVAVGGRTGRDGIHGATFSSIELSHQSETASGGAVQIGNAIAEKMLLDVILAARDRGLYHAITDCGAGGFSSAVGEMGAETGAEVWLERAPLKYAGLTYTEIWISESQERMVLAVPPASWEAFQALCAAEGVEATVIGRYTDTRRLVLKYDGHQVGELSMEFLHEGRPAVIRDAVWEPRVERRELRKSGKPNAESGEPNAESAVGPEPWVHRADRSTFDAQRSTAGDVLKAILSSLNVCSKEWIIRQYDHEVQAGSVVKPLVGAASDGPSDAAVVRPDLNSQRGIVIACGMNPRYGDRDPYWMAASAIDEAVRNCVAVGADPRRIAILDNFCWGNTDRPETLGSLVRAALGCHDTAVAYGTPFVSGKDSLNNEFTYGEDSGFGIRDSEQGSEASGRGSAVQRTISIPPSLLITALGQIEDIERAVTMDLKQPGNVLFLIGRTHDELGGSHFEMLAKQGGAAGSGPVPRVDFEHAPAVFSAVHAANRSGVVCSCHDLSEGGLAVAVAEMAFAGGWGAELDLADMSRAAGAAEPHLLLFSESNTRFVVEVRPECVAEFLRIAPAAVRLGTVTDSDRLIVRGADRSTLIDERLDELKHAWQSPLAWE